MLKELHIKNVILIKEISIYFNKGFSVFTGETGSGKSILLDCLALSLGDRANFSFIRKGEDKGEIIAIFEDINPEIKRVLRDNSIDVLDDDIILRRIINVDGKSKAFINDIPVTVTFLKQIGSMLLDIHGQFDNQKLINPSFHREILDNFIADKEVFNLVENSYHDYKENLKNFKKKQNEIEEVLKEKDYLEFVTYELRKLDVQEDEEQSLLERKQLFVNSRKIQAQVDKLNKILNDDGVLGNLAKSFKQVDELQNLLPESDEVKALKDNLDKSYSFLIDSVANIENISTLTNEGDDLNYIEERLMNLRVIAKKHRVQIDELPNILATFEEKLLLINTSKGSLEFLQEELDKSYDLYCQYAENLSKKRKEVAQILDKKVNNELAFLKLDSASFQTEIIQDGEGLWGKDKVVFMAKTNKGSDWGYLNKIASGGEMARFMLALKIILSEGDIVSTLILDEIDIGVGGEVAEAIGKRLSYLSQKIQIIVVTHSHQVASKGDYHYLISKKDISNEETQSEIHLLDYEKKVEEIARMLSGTNITPEARATAINMLSSKNYN